MAPSSRLKEEEEPKQDSEGGLYPDFKQDEIKLSIEQAERDQARRERMQEMDRSKVKSKPNFLNMLNLSNKGGEGAEEKENFRDGFNNIYRSNLFLGDLGSGDPYESPQKRSRNRSRSRSRSSGSKDGREREKKDRRGKK